MKSVAKRLTAVAVGLLCVMSAGVGMASVVAREPATTADVGTGSDRDAGAQAPALKASRWEYGVIEYSRGTSPWFPGSTSGTGGDRLLWNTAGLSVDGRSWRDLAVKMKASVPDKAASVKLALMDYLGAQGWELVGVTVPTGQDAPSWTWTFKRKLE